jgi:light-regulated signal transduction histidine kinase (bacteriophytochrome)
LAVSNKELEDFAYVASHDLQEPLRMVTGFLGQIEKKYSTAIDDRGRQYIHFAVDGAKRMRRIILDLLEFSRIGRMEEKEERIDLNELVAEIIILSQTRIQDSNAIINTGKLPSLVSYKAPVRQVFYNLINNALKYHNEHVQTIINISVKETADGWQFSIEDNGIGIEEEYYNRIFLLFQRLHNKDEYSGTGIGLAICKKIIENFGGKIWVRSKYGVGSTFYFTLQNIDTK